MIKNNVICQGNTTIMKKITTNTYDVLFGIEAYDFLGNFLREKGYSKIFIITDSNCHEYCLPRFLAHLSTEIPFEIIEVDNGESSKTIETCISIWQVLTELGADRKSVVINVGGGVVTDLGGFVASTYKRGIDHIQIPTSLLGMVDASIGGKTGIDLDGIKNQIGTFTSPKMVIIDVEYLETLESRELRAGYAEMLKHALICDLNYWNVLKDTANIDFNDLESLIYHSVFIKNEIVSQDPEEKGVRKCLNFGHTLGHGLESYFLYNDDKELLLHGEAVAIGLILESYLSWKKESIDEDTYKDIKSVIFSIFPKVILTAEDINGVKEWLKHDKKSIKNVLQFVLLKGIGRFELNQNVEEQLIDEAFEDYLR